jgi:hypothetical protein
MGALAVPTNAGSDSCNLGEVEAEKHGSQKFENFAADKDSVEARAVNCQKLKHVLRSGIA